MIDAILYVPDFPALVAHLDTHHPAMLARDESGALVQPPVVVGFARTPAVATPDGAALMVYARLRGPEVEQWHGMPGVEVLAEAPFTGLGTAQAVYDQVFADPDALAAYDAVYDRTPRQVNDGEGGTLTVTPPAWFGLIAGA
ncbi:hypothetical protein [Halomonas nitroreducens]|uniref:Uncharacterized protein n=1 Tax=Halomonas nitroreducens TaxID=447425 RepID=A0A3S0J8V4_9GAMM|nr:hypothetical protein [Halomonas nitroreducens]RTR01929.1 hypothetical protein EKG36_13045 [Halomonas nitroreducens]